MQHGDDLGLGIGVDRPVALAHIAAHGIHRRPAGEVDREFALNRALEFGPAQLVDQRAEMAFDLQFAGRVRTGPWHLRVVGENRVEGVAFEEVGHDDEFERIAHERRLLKRGEIAVAHRPLQSVARSRDAVNPGRAYSRSPRRRQGIAGLSQRPGAGFAALQASRASERAIQAIPGRWAVRQAHSARCGRVAQ